MKDNKKANLGEKISLTFKKKWLTSKAKTLLIAVILIAIFLVLNIWTQTLDLPEIDITENKIYTLSDASIEAVAKVNQNVHIYAYGFEEDSSLINFLKQYNKANDKITYEVLTEESNPQKVKENDLSEGYTVLIMESGDSKKVIDAQNEFYTYDLTTYQQVDVTEQCITNSILSLNVENKPMVYFMQGHNEFTSDELYSLQAYLTNEAYEYQTLDLLTTGKVPDDCSVLLILSPASDLIEAEVTMIQEYINKGGNIIFTQDMLSQEVEFPNLQKVLDMYGVSVENGYIVETDGNNAVSNYPYIFKPNVSATNNITSNIYTDSYMLLIYASRLNLKSDEELTNLKVTNEELLYSSDEAYFVKDLSTSINDAITNSSKGKNVISYMLTKDVSSSEETEETLQSKLVISATGSFISDYSVSAISQQTPLSSIASNRDFMLNAIAELTEREGTLTIRKDMTNVTYMPTETENRVVLIIIFVVPVLIILIGVVIGKIRKRRK